MAEPRPDRPASVPGRATAPGRVNLIGDHTDYNRGLALPMAIQLGITVEFEPAVGSVLDVHSTELGDATVDLGGALDAAAIARVEPSWLRLVAATCVTLGWCHGGRLTIDSELPVGVGLSSSAALGVALDELFGGAGTPTEIALRCQAAEHLAGVPVGTMDPLVAAGAHRGSALLIDFDMGATADVPLPDELAVLVVDSGERRALSDSAYAARVAECEAAASVIGPLGRATDGDLAHLDDPVLIARARHVVSECRRVRAFVDALGRTDVAEAGRLMTASHRSLADDFDVSTPHVDALVDEMVARPEVLGARMTGGGFGGCVVALCSGRGPERGRGCDRDDSWITRPHWWVEAVDGTIARRVEQRSGR